MPYDTVQCLECGKWFVCVSRSHLKAHKLTCKEYLQKYLGAKLTSESFNDKLSEIRKEQWKDPESNYNKNKIEINEKHSKSLIETWKDPECSFNKPEVREKYSEAMIKKWEDPESGFNRPESDFNKPEWKEKVSKSLIEAWEDPECSFNKPERGEKISKAMTKRWVNGSYSEVNFGAGIGGKRADLNNQFFRSTWEANVARILNFWGIKWEYEVKRIPYNNGTKTHMIDFYLPETDSYLEIYGYMNKRHLEEFYGVYESGLSVQIIGPEVYKDLEQEFKNKLPFWESDKNNIRTREKEKEMD